MLKKLTSPLSTPKLQAATPSTAVRNGCLPFRRGRKNSRRNKFGEVSLEWHDIEDQESFLSADSDFDTRGKLPHTFSDVTPKLCVPSKSWQANGKWVVKNVTMPQFFAHFFAGQAYACAPQDTVKVFTPWERGHRKITINTPESGIVHQEQYLWREHNDIELIKVTLCEGNNAFENDFRLLEKWCLHDQEGGITIIVFTGVHWLNSWSLAKVGEPMMHSKLRKPIDQFKDASLKINFSNQLVNSDDNVDSHLGLENVHVGVDNINDGSNNNDSARRNENDKTKRGEGRGVDAGEAVEKVHTPTAAPAPFGGDNIDNTNNINGIDLQIRSEMKSIQNQEKQNQQRKLKVSGQVGQSQNEKDDIVKDIERLWSDQEVGAAARGLNVAKERNESQIEHGNSGQKLDYSHSEDDAESVVVAQPNLEEFGEIISGGGAVKPSATEDYYNYFTQDFPSWDDVGQWWKFSNASRHVEASDLRSSGWQVSVHKEGDHQVIQVTTRIPIKPEPKNRTRVITKTTLPAPALVPIPQIFNNAPVVPSASIRSKPISPSNRRDGNVNTHAITNDDNAAKVGPQNNNTPSAKNAKSKSVDNINLKKINNKSKFIEKARSLLTLQRSGSNLFRNNNSNNNNNAASAPSSPVAKSAAQPICAPTSAARAPQFLSRGNKTNNNTNGASDSTTIGVDISCSY